MLVGEFIANTQKKLSGKSKEWLVNYAGDNYEWFNAEKGAKFFLAGCGLLNYDTYDAVNSLFVAYHYVKNGTYTERELLEKIEEELRKL